MRYAKPPINKIIFPLVIGLQICILAWMNAYGTWAENYVSDGHEEERKRIIEAVEKEFKNQRGSGVYTGTHTGTTERSITSNFKTNQRQKGNAVIVSQKGKNSDIQVTKFTTGASVDMPKSGIIKKSVKKECDKDCKIQVLVKNGIRKEISETLVNECKDDKCIKMGASIATAESGGGDKCFNNNCMGMGCPRAESKKVVFSCISSRSAYKSVEEGITHWTEQYYRLWYKSKSMSFFYPKKGDVSPSRYCTDEKSSKSDVGCPNGLKHSQSMFNLLNKQF